MVMSVSKNNSDLIGTLISDSDDLTNQNLKICTALKQNVWQMQTFLENEVNQIDMQIIKL